MQPRRDLGLLGETELVSASNLLVDNYSRARETARVNPILRGDRPDDAEYLVAILAGTKRDQLKMWPEIARMIEIAQTKNWDREVFVVPLDDARKKLTTHNFGSFENLYAELCEPWLGPLSELRATYAKLLRGEITREEGRRQVVAQAAGKTTGKVLPEGRPEGTAEQRSNLPRLFDRAASSGVSKRTQQKLDALARVRPDLLEEVRRTRMSAHSAAIAAGIVKPVDHLAALKRHWLKATVEEREAFAIWRRQREADG